MLLPVLAWCSRAYLGLPAGSDLPPLTAWTGALLVLVSMGLVVGDQWSDAPRVGTAVRLGPPPQAVMFDYQRARVQLQPVDGDRLHLCERPAVGSLVGRGIATLTSWCGGKACSQAAGAGSSGAGVAVRDVCNGVSTRTRAAVRRDPDRPR